MKDNQAFKEKLKKLETINNVDKLQLEICSILSFVIISKEFFRYTKDIHPFLKSLDIDFKEYVFKNRLLLLGKLLKKVMDEDQKERIIFYQKTIYEIILGYYNQTDKLSDSSGDSFGNNTKNVNSKKRNYMMDLLNKYSRKK